MIAIENSSGELVKILKGSLSTEFGFHEMFGFISKNKAKKRIIARKRQGFEFNRDGWRCSFTIKANGNVWELSNFKDCEAQRIDDNNWKLITKTGEFTLRSQASGNLPSIDETISSESGGWLNKMVERGALLLLLALPIVYLLQTDVEKPLEKEIVSEKITVKVVEKVNTVNIAQNTPKMKVKPLTKEQRAHRAAQRNLGFLGMVGDKSVKDAVGGVPQKLKKATAGAGKGGDAGSGGEMLAGLGKGLKKTTVGNTGVAGLGGVGTKGAGGGKGGYGNSMVASGEGKGISSIAVSSSEMVLEGGLSRYAINATIAKYLGQVRKCYESQLKLKPELQGMVTVAFQIGGNGMLNHSKVAKSSLGNSIVETCITTKMMGWQFPKPKGGVNVNVNYPFMLRPVGI